MGRKSRYMAAFPTWFVVTAAAYCAAPAGQSAGTATSALVQVGASGTAEASNSIAACDLTVHATRFVESLAAYRGGDDTALTALRQAAHRLRVDCGRSDPAQVAAFYSSLSADEREAGVLYEQQLDLLRELASEIPAGNSPTLATRTNELIEQLHDFDSAADGLADVAVRAQALSLAARLSVRLVERSALPMAALPRIVEQAGTALALFREAGQLTPTLEPLWVLARCHLLNTEFDLAEDAFVEMDHASHIVGRDTWRERALLGLVGIAREHGSPFEADGWLEELGSFRDPSSCWALAREVAVQRLFADDSEGALDWLEENPPSPFDDEIEGEFRGARAGAEWRSLISAAELRSGHIDRARERLKHGPDQESGANVITALTLVAIHLNSNEPHHALELVQSLDSTLGTNIHQAERLTLEGRTWMALGQAANAIVALEQALKLTGHQDGSGLGRSRAGTEVQSGSRIGEWLGLSAIETLGRAYVETGDPLRAAGLFEWAHAQALSRVMCEARLLDLAGQSDLGYVTWMVGADQTLCIHVMPNGEAHATPIPVGRRGLERATLRLRDALAEATTDAGDQDAQPSWCTLGQELTKALFPAHLLAAIADRDAAGATLTLGPHGVLERLPFEALPIPYGNGSHGHGPLGIATALSIMTALRPGEDLAPPLDGPRAPWTALGAPATTQFDELPGARLEIASIGRLQPNWTAHVGPAMTRDALHKALQGDGPVHIATHVAKLSAGHGPRSVAPMGFVVTGDEIVSAAEVRGLSPKLPLAILTACGSAEGRSIDGLSVRGMAQTLLAGGTRSAIVTLWPIQDQPATRAAIRLHAALQGGATPAEATRRAREFLWLLGELPSEWAAYRTLE